MHVDLQQHCREADEGLTVLGFGPQIISVTLTPYTTTWNIIHSQGFYQSLNPPKYHQIPPHPRPPHPSRCPPAYDEPIPNPRERTYERSNRKTTSVPHTPPHWTSTPRCIRAASGGTKSALGVAPLQWRGIAIERDHLPQQGHCRSTPSHSSGQRGRTQSTGRRACGTTARRTCLRTGGA